VKEFIDEAGSESISTEQLERVFANNDIRHYELTEGDVNTTIPEYVDSNPELRISLLNIDINVYEGTKTILDEFYPRVVSGGVILFDDYGKSHETTRVIDEYLSESELDIKKLVFARQSPCAIKL